MQNLKRITLIRERIFRPKCTNNFQGQASFWDNDYFDYIFLSFSKDSPKNGPKVKKSNRKIKNDDTETGITQVLIELQQKFFHQHWAQKWT